MASIHETAEDLYEAGLMEKHTMREFDELCLTPISYDCTYELNVSILK